MLISNGDRVIRVFPKARKLEIDDIDNACGGESGSCSARLDRVPMDGHTPDPTNPATAGCLLMLLGPSAQAIRLRAPGWSVSVAVDPEAAVPEFIEATHEHLGAACIAVAERLGRWPGGAS